MKNKKVITIISVFVSLYILGAIIMMVQKSGVYSRNNTMSGEYEKGYLFGEVKSATSVIVNDIGRYRDLIVNNKTLKNCVVLDLTMPYDKEHDFYYYLFSENEDVDFLVYDEESKESKIKNVTYIRDKFKNSLNVVLEVEEDCMPKWVRIFGLNEDRGMYEKSSLTFSINIPK